MALLVLVVLAVVAVALSGLPPADKAALHTTGSLHPWFHLGLFMVLGALAIRVSARWQLRLALLVAAILLGLGIEVSEAARWHIPIEGYDIVTDTAGVVLGAVGSWLFTRRRPRVLD